MLYLLLGADRKKVNSLVEKEGKGNSIQKLDVFSWDVDLVRSSVESHSLFGGDEEAMILDGIFESEEAGGLLSTLLEGMEKSNKKFFIVESDLSDEVLGILKKKGAKVSDFREKKEHEWKKKFNNNDKYNPFALADAVGKKSAKESWIEYQRARLAGAEPEELHSKVWGKARDMISSEKATADELGIHPFVHKKAKADSKNWPKEKLDLLTQNLLGIYHQARLGGDELDLAMEKILLSI